MVIKVYKELRMGTNLLRMVEITGFKEVVMVMQMITALDDESFTMPTYSKQPLAALQVSTKRHVIKTSRQKRGEGVRI
jgi:hypothetical protein